jgi:hypothetical protein
VDAFGTGIFSVNGRTDLVSEVHRRDTVNIAASASPKGTLDCTQAFSLTCFRDDLARDHDPDSRHPRQRRRDRPIRDELAPHQLGIAGNSLAPMRDVPHG